MKLKTLLNLAIAFCAITFIACEDDINSIGSSIQPEGDDIFVGTDTVTLKAETVSLKDSVYARTSNPVLGEYQDPIFGKIKSDYLLEIYCPEKTATSDPIFHEKTVSIDSVFLNIESLSFSGDSISPLGVSIYRATEPLKGNFFTNINPKDYCDMRQLLGQGIFTVKDAPKKYYSNGYSKQYTTRLNRSLGQEFYDEWIKSKGETFKNQTEFRKFFKGMYITTVFGSGTLLNASNTELRIHYSYTGRNKDNTKDSIMPKVLTMGYSLDVLQLNHIQNSIPNGLLASDTTKSYIKSPAGVCTQLTIPLKEIIEKAEKKAGKRNVINAANFKLIGFTEEEDKSKLNRPVQLLLINKDSVPNFFMNRKMADGKTSFLMSRTSNNMYYILPNTHVTDRNGSVSPMILTTNFADLINHYIKEYKGKTDIPDLKYLVIPVSTNSSVQVSSGSYIKTYTDVYNLMETSSAIFRTNKKNMRMPLVISRYNESQEK